MWIDGRPKLVGNIVVFINSTQPRSTNKKMYFIFEVHEGNHVFISVIKLISVGEELLINYNLNHIGTNILTIACHKCDIVLYAILSKGSNLLGTLNDDLELLVYDVQGKISNIIVMSVALK